MSVSGENSAKRRKLDLQLEDEDDHGSTMLPVNLVGTNGGFSVPLTPVTPVPATVTFTYGGGLSVPTTPLSYSASSLPMTPTVSTPTSRFNNPVRTPGSGVARPIREPLRDSSDSSVSSSLAQASPQSTTTGNDDVDDDDDDDEEDDDDDAMSGTSSLHSFSSRKLPEESVLVLNLTQPALDKLLSFGNHVLSACDNKAITKANNSAGGAEYNTITGGEDKCDILLAFTHPESKTINTSTDNTISLFELCGFDAKYPVTVPVSSSYSAPAPTRGRASSHSANTRASAAEAPLPQKRETRFKPITEDCKGQCIQLVAVRPPQITAKTTAFLSACVIDNLPPLSEGQQENPMVTQTASSYSEQVPIPAHYSAMRVRNPSNNKGPSVANEDIMDDNEDDAEIPLFESFVRSRFAHSRMNRDCTFSFNIRHFMVILGTLRVPEQGHIRVIFTDDKIDLEHSMGSAHMTQLANMDLDSAAKHDTNTCKALASTCVFFDDFVEASEEISEETLVSGFQPGQILEDQKKMARIFGTTDVSLLVRGLQLDGNDSVPCLVQLHFKSKANTTMPTTKSNVHLRDIASFKDGHKNKMNHLSKLQTVGWHDFVTALAPFGSHKNATRQVDCVLAISTRVVYFALNIKMKGFYIRSYSCISPSVYDDD